MKKIIRTVAYIILAAAAFGCAKAVSEGPNEANVRYFDAWMKVNNYHELKPTGLGIYILPEYEYMLPETEVEGENYGAEVKKDGFVYVDYVATDLEGNITSYTGKETAKQLGAYDTTVYYGPKVLTTIDNTIQAGLAEALVGMKVGGHRKVIIPGWLMSYTKYDTAEEYLEKSASGSNVIYDITVRDFTDSINVYERNMVDKYVKDNPQIFNDKVTNDTTGFYYQVLREGTSKKEFPKDTTIYINYTGRLLNGLVFDTTDEKTAKDNGLYSASKAYKPVQIKWAEEYTDITMGSGESSVIPGFALTLWQMHPMEKGIGVFYSPLGYSYNGSGSSIPGYAPLVFEIEIVAKPE